MDLRPTLYIAAISAFVVPTLAFPSNAGARPEHPVGPPARIRDSTRHADVNQLNMVVSNIGSFGFDPLTGGPGLEWPSGSDSHTVFAAGLWIGAKVDGETRVTVAQYSTEFAAGPLNAAGDPVDPNQTDSQWRVLKVNRGDDETNPDYALWKQQALDLGPDGPPIDASGNPDFRGDQALWCVYNDAVPIMHTHAAGATQPLGVEVRQMAWGFDSAPPGAAAHTTYLEFTLDNKGGDFLEDVYVGFWFDPDLGDGDNDLVGCDPDGYLGFCYDASEPDAQYGYHAPAVGCRIIRGAGDQGTKLGLSSFTKFVNGTDPASATESYAYLEGGLSLTGDPVFGTGVLDQDPRDKRMLLATGPVDLPPGEVEELVIAITVGGEAGVGDRLSNIERLRSYARHAAAIYDGFGGTFPICDAGGPYTGTTSAPVTLDAAASYDPDGALTRYGWRFADGQVGRGALLNHTFDTPGSHTVKLAIQDDAANASHCATRVIITSSGSLEPYTEATPTGMTGAEYLNINTTHDRALAWVDWGGRFFNGAVDTGCRWSGSTIIGEAGDAGLCPDAELVPERFGTVELRFDATQKAYRYLRKQLGPGGGPPATGRGYDYAGYDDLRCTVWKVTPEGETQLSAMYAERAYAFDDGTLWPNQPESHNALWDPTEELDGGREYLILLDIPYSETPDPEFMMDGIFFLGDIPAIYGAWFQHRPPLDGGDPYVIDPEDKFAFYYANMASTDNAVAVASADVQSDGAHDIYLATASLNRLYTNTSADSMLGFQEVQGDLRNPEHAASIAFGDANGDGNIDVFLGNVGADNVLYTGDGAGGFTDATPDIIRNAGDTDAPLWLDANLDGALDLFLGSASTHNVLLRRDGGDYADIASAALAGASPTHASAADYDADGDTDLYLVGDAINQLFENIGGGGMVDATPLPLANGAPGGMAAWGDFDGDHDLDIAIASPSGVGVSVFQKDGATFTPFHSEPGPTTTVSWADLDHDADLDLHLGRLGQNAILKNEGGTFALQTSDDSGDLVDITLADYDADGDLDIFVANAEGSPNALWAAGLSFTNWLHIDLVGTVSNGMGLGARVFATAGGVTQMREVQNEHHSPTVEFGLGNALQVDQLRIEWPSGIVQSTGPLEAGQRLTVQEPETATVDLDSPSALPAAVALHANVPNPFNPRTTIRFELPEPGNAKLAIYDAGGRLVNLLAQGQRNAGYYDVTWDGKDTRGQSVASGAYYYRLEAAGEAITRKMLLLR